MSKPSFQSPGSEVPQALLDGIAWTANILMWLGGVAALGSLALLLLLASSFTEAGGAHPATGDAMQAALNNIDLLRKVLGVGLMGFGVGSAITWWTEPKLPITHILVAAIIVFAPQYVPLILGDPSKRPVMLAVLESIQGAGILFALVASIVVILDVGLRVKERLAVGMKLDTLKYGQKGVKEAGASNQFMGKCWQLPYCRKFVRERCPIYHARKACWREKVGCMCEEEVIRAAMENRAIPKDAVAAAKYIPQNNKITFKQKVARCRQCVIYNEHQKHKYKLWLFITNVSFLAIAVLGWQPLSAWAGAMIHSMDKLYGQMTFRDAHLSEFLSSSAIPFQSLLLGVILLVAFTYTLKILEFLIFKAKI